MIKSLHPHNTLEADPSWSPSQNPRIRGLERRGEELKSGIQLQSLFIDAHTADGEMESQSGADPGPSDDSELGGT